MLRKEILDYVKTVYGTIPDYPWDNFPNYAVLRHKNSGKWYGLIMEVGKDKLHLTGSGLTDIINMKADTNIIGSLCKKDGLLPAYHMNKEHWITAILNSPAENDILMLLDESYRLTKKRK